MTGTNGCQLSESRNCWFNLTKGKRLKCQHSNLFTVFNLTLVINSVDKPNIHDRNNLLERIGAFPGWKRILSTSRFQKKILVPYVGVPLRTVTTFVTVHTFCASQNTWVSCWWCLLIQGYFCMVQKNFAEKAELSKCSWYPKRKFGVAMHFSEIIKLQFGKNAIYCFVFYCLKNNCCLIISKKNAWLPPIIFFGFQ